LGVKTGFEKCEKMSNSVQAKTIDYPYLITLGGVGVLSALACLMVGVAVDNVALGYFLGAGCLLIAVVVIVAKLYTGRDRNVQSPESLSVTRIGQPQAITSLEGDLIYCNAPYRVFLKEQIRRDILSPVELLTADQATQVKEDMAALVMESEDVRHLQLHCGDEEIRYAEVTLSRKTGHEGYVSWTFTGQTSEVPLDRAQSGNRALTLSQLGRFLDFSDCGLIALTPKGEITYANGILLHWLTGEVPDEMPTSLYLSDFCTVSAQDLSGKILMKTARDEELYLEFLPMGHDLVKQLASDQARDTAVICHVSLCQAEDSAEDVSTENINIDRFFRESPIGIAIVAENGDVLERNQIFREYVTDLDIKNARNLKNIVDEGEFQEFYEKIEGTLESGQASSISDVGFRGVGDKHGQFYITRLNKFADREQVAILYLIDTTEQKNLELQFAQSQKMQAVGQLAGGIAHDFNNLLTAIIGFSDLLLVRHGPGDQSFSDIIQIKQNANRAANLVRQLLAFSRQQTLRPKVLIITDVLAELSNLLGRLIGDNIELEMKHGRDLGRVKVDQGQMEQVIINLCVNARDAMDNKGKISIRTRNISMAQSKVLSERYQVMPENEYILLEVEDTGSGIAKEHLGKIFEPFFSTKEVGKGTGLGLSTVYGIVKQTDGFIFPTSEVGKGTTFSIYLPVYVEKDKQLDQDVASGKPEEEKPARDLTGKGTILLVEDEDAVRMFASRALKNKGYQVYEANSGEAAMDMFKQIEDELDLLISDVVMPLMDGPTLVRKIRDINKDLKVIFISGYAEDAFDKTPGEEDFHFLPKPFSLKQLAEQVKEVLESN
tara:strand:+ start:2817 stop:5315 length:2499 start_codon:yes stop_codon:yes gene_type:complete